MTLTDVRVGRWLTVAIGARSDSGPTVTGRRLVLRVLALTLAVFAAVVTVAGGLVAKSLAESLAVDSAQQRAGILAVDVAGPAIGNGILTGNPSDIARLDRRVREHVLAPDIARVKVWTANGTIVYSDEARLIGQRFALGGEERKAIETNGSDAEISDLSKPENRYERSAGTLLEVYRVVRTPNGTPLLFEVYFRYNEVVTRMDRIWRAFGGIAFASLVLLLIALVP
ncbi:MAG: two-component system, NarL family, sensor kinase, partial [Microbacteriaceae bacterium]|nr:two-component system, NarL family, sensor kinase [Microbacteriaceae bacterium]